MLLRWLPIDAAQVQRHLESSAGYRRSERWPCRGLGWFSLRARRLDATATYWIVRCFLTIPGAPIQATRCSEFLRKERRFCFVLPGSAGDRSWPWCAGDGCVHLTATGPNAKSRAMMAPHYGSAHFDHLREVRAWLCRMRPASAGRSLRSVFRLTQRSPVMAGWSTGERVAQFPSHGRSLSPIRSLFWVCGIQRLLCSLVRVAHVFEFLLVAASALVTRWV